MKKFWVLGLLLFCALAARAQAAYNVSAKFDYDFTYAPACSTTVTTWCVDHFELWDTTTASKALLKTVPLPATATGKVTGIATTFVWSAGMGNRNLSAVCGFRDGTGTVVFTDPVKMQVVVQLPANPPTGFVVVTIG